MKSKYQSQQIVKEDNERKILVLLRENPLRFNELLSGTGLSRRGLSEILDRLRSENKIEKAIYDNAVVYAITDFGTIYFQERLWQVFGTMMDMKVENPLYLHSNLFFGASMDMIVNDETLVNPLFGCFPDSDEISLYLLEAIFNNFKKKQIKIDGKVDGKLVFAFEFDLDDMSEQISNALRIIEDLEQDADILEDDRLSLRGDHADLTRHSIVSAMTTIGWLVSPEKHKELREKMAMKMNEKTHPEIFSNLDSSLLSKVFKIVKGRTWEKDFQSLTRELEKQAHNFTDEHVSELYYYIDALKIMNMNDDGFYQDLEVFHEFMAELAKKRVEDKIMRQESETNTPKDE